MKKNLKLILMLVVVMIIIIVTIVALVKKKELNNKDKIIYIEEYDELAERSPELHVEENINRFFIVKNCVEQFFEYNKYLNKETIDVEIEDEELDMEKLKKWYGEKLYALLDKEYINYKNITLENICDNIEGIEETKPIIDKIYTKDLESSSYICFVEGRMQKENSAIKNFKMVVRLSSTNTFKIFLEDYLISKGYDDFSKDIDIKELCKFEITDEKYNTYKSKAISMKDYVSELFSHYKFSVINDEEYAYEKLINKEYKDTRFDNIEEYKKYVKNNYSKVTLMALDSYSQKTINEINQYLCKDNYGNYYIFKETAPFQYTVMLDNYTIPTEEFTEEYNKSSETKKVILNIKRFFMGIDDKNYGYSYSVLSEGFKNNKYSTKDDFVKYVKQNFFEENKIEYVSYEKENGVHIYKIKLTDGTGKTSQEKELNIIMKLNNGTNFEMSFGEN